MQKTIIVRVEHQLRHPLYKRIVRRYSKFKVHDENGQAKVGDKVKIKETRPLSKDKRWTLLEVVKSNEAQTYGANGISEHKSVG